MAADEIDLTARARSARVVRWIGHVLVLLIAAGCLASLMAGPEGTGVRLIAGAAGLLTVLLYARVLVTRRRLPARLVVDHEGKRRCLVSLGDGQGQEFPVGEAVGRWRPQLWRGHRPGSFLLGGEGAWRAFLAERRGPGRGNA